jgi:hypothetical protein
MDAIQVETPRPRPEGVGFPAALVALKEGSLVARRAWIERGGFLRAMRPLEVTINVSIVEGALYAQAPWIGMKTPGDTFEPWTPSHEDLFAEDWMIVKPWYAVGGPRPVTR